MKRSVCLALVLLMLAAACVGAAAETVTALDGKQNGSNENVLFSGGYRGYCIDRDKHGAVKDDVFSVAENTAAAAISNTTPPTDISQKLKTLFTQCFDQVFEANETGEYLLKEGMSNILLGAVYHYSEGQYVWGEQAKLTKTVDEYKGAPIPDDGYCLELDNGDIVTFSFKVFEPYMIVTPTNNGTQTFFAYKLTVEHPGETEIYTVTFDANSGSGTMEPQEFEADKAEVLTANAFTRDGYTFTGWNTKADGSGVSYTDEQSVTVSGDMTLYAQWKQNPRQVTVTTDGNGTVSVEPNPAVPGAGVVLKVTPAEGYELDELKVNNGAVTVSQNEDGTYTFKMPDEDAAVTATFKQIEDTVSYTVTITNDGNGTGSANPASGETGTEVTLSAAPKSGYQFKEWQVVSGGVTVENDKFTIGTENVEIKAIFEKVPEETIYTVTVTNDGNGTGSANPASGATGTEVTLSAAPKEGYQFKAWEVFSGGVTVTDNKFTIGTQNVEIKAIFEKIPEEYDVTVSFEGVGAVMSNLISAAEGEEVTLRVEAGSGYRLASLTINGEEKAGDVQNNLYIFKMPKGDVEIQAVFEAIPEELYTVTFNANGGSGEMADQMFEDDVKQPLRKNTFIRGGYTFTGWNTKADGTGTAYTDEQSVTVADNMTLYACWEKDAGLLRITRQPQDQFVTEGQKAEFSVEAEGDGLTYQWYVDRGDGKGLVELKGAEDASYVTSATNLSNDGYVYVCRITDENGHTVTSEAAVLHVSTLPVLPQTGDSSAPALYLALGMLSVLGLVVLGKRSCVR